MRRVFVAVTLAAICGGILAGTALAVAPSLSSLRVENRHPAATIAAPKADFVTIYFATKPDRSTDGSFLSENVDTSDSLTDSEIQSGQWLYESKLDPGTYWVMLRASADFSACWIFDEGRYDPSCADGYSDVAQLTVPKPASRYTAQVRSSAYLSSVDLRLTATTIGEKRPYRVCFKPKKGGRRCLSGTLDGYSWDSGADDLLTVSKRILARTTTFTWYVGTAPVASKTVRIG